ncbi:MAG: C40 family peptidase [Bacteroidales bacterium]|nr:C40 family peptidase [Bacteroidales bacterium]
MKRLLIIFALAGFALACTGCKNNVEETASQQPQSSGFAVSLLSVVNHHEEPDVDKEIGCQSLMGTVLSVLDYLNGWYKVETPEGYVAWVSSEAIVLKDSDQLAEWNDSPKLIVTAISDVLYSEPYLGSDIICDITLGDVLVKGEKNGEFCTCFLPNGKTAYVQQKNVMDLDAYNESIITTGDSVVAIAMQFLGFPYVWGWNCAKGMDCSGFTQFVYHLHGLALPRNSSAQARTGEEISIEDNLELLLPGDLVFFCNTTPGRVNHVGIYIGNGEFIHCGTSCVKINSLYKDAVNLYPKADNLYCARRIITAEW